MIESSVHPSEPVTLPIRPSGQVVRSVVGHGAVGGLMIASNLEIFVPAVLIHCALRNGRRSAWGALALTIGFTGLLIAPAASVPLLIAKAGAIVLALALPAIAAIPLVERGEPFGRVVMFLLAGAAIGYAATELIARAFTSFSPYAAYVEAMKKTTAAIVSNYRAGGGQDAALFERMMEYCTSNLLTGLLLTSAALSFVLSLLMIGRLRAWRDHVAQQGRDTGTYLFRNFALPEWMLFAFVLGGLAPLAGGLLQQVASNVLIVTLFLYMLQGFALLRSLLAAVGIGFIGALIASAFAVLTGIGVLLLTVAGLFDPFFDFRHYKKRKDDSHESHSD